MFATIALHFVRDVGQFDELIEYAKLFNSALDRPVDHSFADPAEAELWLGTAKAGSIGKLVAIAEDKFMVVPDVPPRLKFIAVDLE